MSAPTCELPTTKVTVAAVGLLVCVNEELPCVRYRDLCRFHFSGRHRVFACCVRIMLNRVETRRTAGLGVRGGMMGADF